MTTDAVFPPFHYVHADGVLAGFDVDLAREVFRRIGEDCKVVRSPSYESMFLGLDSGHFDAVVATTGITEERLEKWAFSEPYFTTALAVMVREGVEEPQSPADLRGRRVAASKGTTSAKAARDIGAVLVEQTRAAHSLAALRDGEVDAVIVDEFEAVPWAEEAAEFRVLREPAAQERYGIVMRRDEVELRDRVNEALAAMVADGTMAKLRERHGLDRPADWPVHVRE